MDQDFPYYGAYYAARATGNLSMGVEGGACGLWASFHFLPGNTGNLNGTPRPDEIHGPALAALLPPYETRDVRPEVEGNIAPLLTRPQSPLSRHLFRDAILCMGSKPRLAQIIGCAAGGKEILASPDREEILNRFALLLLGARSHTIADTWAHQDWSPVNHEVNTYWDVNDDWLGRQSIDYTDIRDDWKNVVLSSMNHENLRAVPNSTTYFGHGWMGHLPDYGFINYQYKPCWRSQTGAPFRRNNPAQFQYAFLELCSLFSQAKGGPFDPQVQSGLLAAAGQAVTAPCEIADESICPREFSSQQWMAQMDRLDIERPMDIINTELAPDPKAVLPGRIDFQPALGTRYGTYFINCVSDLYLFAIAADYQFLLVKHWLQRHNIGTDLFTDAWATQYGPLQNGVDQLF